MGKPLRRGFFRIALALSLAIYQIYILRSFSPLTTLSAGLFKASPIAAIKQTALIFHPVVIAVILAVFALKDFFSPHPIIKIKYETVYKSSTLVFLNNPPLIFKLLRPLCAISVVALNAFEAWQKLSILLESASFDAQNVRTAWELLFLCAASLCLAFSLVLCNVENPAESLASALVCYGGLFGMSATVSEPATLVFRNTVSPIRSTQFFSALCALIFVALGISLYKKGLSAFEKNQFKIPFAVACALCIVLSLAPYLPNFDILFIADIASKTLPKLAIPCVLLVFQPLALAATKKHSADYQALLKKKYNLDNNSSPISPRIDYYDFSDTQPTDNTPPKKK